MERAVEILLLASLSFPLVRLAALEPVRAEFAARPVWRLALVSLGALGLVLASVVAFRGGGGLRLLTALVAVVALAAWWRARPDYGKRRDLPPGSLGLASSMASLSDPDFYSREADRHGPVFKMSQFHQPTVCIVDLPLGFAFLEEWAGSLKQPELDFAAAVPGNYLELMDGEPHRKYRGIFQPALTGSAIRDCRADVEDAVRRGLDRMADDARDVSDDQTGGKGQSPGPYLDRIALESLLAFLLGVRAGTPHFDRFDEIYQKFGATGDVPALASEDLTNIVALASSAIGELAKSPDLDPKCALGSAVREHPDCADDPVFLGNLAFMLQIGRNNMGGFLGWALKLASEHPEWWQRLRDAGTAAEGIATRMVSETLRLAQSEYVYRVVTRECQLGDHRIPEGWLVRLCLRECHRREDLFPDPERFDPERFLDMSQGKLIYAPFGDGGHACFSGALATMIGRVFLLEVARGFEPCVVSDGPPERGSRHWKHWVPSSSFRLTLNRRDSTLADAVRA